MLFNSQLKSLFEGVGQWLDGLRLSDRGPTMGWQSSSVKPFIVATYHYLGHQIGIEPPPLGTTFTQFQVSSS
jgi:hypothetical protein